MNEKVLVYLVISLFIKKGELLKYAFEDKAIIEKIPESKEEVISLIGNADLFSENQKKALYLVLLLYIKVIEDESLNETLIYTRNIFNIPKEIQYNCDCVFTSNRINYIKDFYSKNNNLVSLVIAPEDFVCQMITELVEMPIEISKIRLDNLSTIEYEHPDDRKTLQTLKNNIGLEKAISLLNKYNVEKLTTIQLLGSNFHVTKNSYKYLYDIFIEACEILNIKDIPELYIEQDFINAHTYGVNKPIVSIASSAVSLLNRNELLFILGHELGHIKSKHLLYQEVAQCIPYLGNIVGDFTLGIGEIVAKGFELALYNWQRKSELTADRAGLLACQNISSAISVFQKISGLPTKIYDSASYESFLLQAEEFEELDNGVCNKLIKLYSSCYLNHPWAVFRAKELAKWEKSDEYKSIISNRNNLKIEDLSIENTIICSTCGKSISPHSVYCSNCGTKQK